MNALKQVGCDAMVAENVKCGTEALCMGCQKTEILNETVNFIVDKDDKK